MFHQIFIVVNPFQNKINNKHIHIERTFFKNGFWIFE